MKPLPAGNTWFIAAVTADHSLEASFAPNAPAPDLGMHITSPVEGATLTGSMMSVSGTFDAAQSGNFNLVVTIASVGIHIYPFTVPTAATTWGPVAISHTDFPDLVSGETYGLPHEPSPWPGLPPASFLPWDHHPDPSPLSTIPSFSHSPPPHAGRG